ncbi:UNVERIFIED_CONTAM: putative disease resistance RPP13-like protein 1 [Sesamum calycinum]|uniref:Disease resistance RPP13-like protein 1 n=1 Tax=Sesamum calycinum TaxID=2727403 RepID=A0AAW2SAS4_9LAMI
MADAGVSMVSKRLAPLIEEKVREEVCLLLNANNEAQNLSEKLKKISEVLADAERKGVADPKVKSWLEKLENISYDIDDVLDEWELENIRQKLEESEDGSHQSSDDSWEKKVCSFLESVCLCFKQTIQRRSIAKNMKGVNRRLDSIAQENEDEFKFIPNLDRNSGKDFQPNPSNSFVDVSKIHGRDIDKETLVTKLLSESSSRGDDDSVPIFSIVGAGGMGKTTVARFVFEDDRVKNYFKLLIWVGVPNPFDEIKIAKAILEITDKDSSSLCQPQALLQSIKKSVSGKKFLLVLDNVLDDNDTKWEHLTACLKSGAFGSKILVTTRNEKVTKITNTTYVHPLQPLSDLYCCQEMQGLPLAAKTMGGLLRYKASLQEWRDVLKSEMWELEDVRKNLFPVLTLSYNELHPVVKRCFSYCAIFPKGTIIHVDKLIRIWMAQGFLSSSGSSASEMEVAGRHYFEDLAMRSFFQDFSKDEREDRTITCKMHEIIHEFAQFLTEKECLIVKRVDGGAKVVSGQNARHLNIVEADGKINMGGPFLIWQTERLRSFFCSTKQIPSNLFSQLKRVRSLILSDCNLSDVPKEIGNLIHLRYLGLSNNPMKDLPETIYNLYYLQTLDITYCDSLSGLPAEGIHCLINLRHLLNYEASLDDFKLPQGFEKLTNLCTLDEFCASATGNRLGCLKDLNQLSGTLRIRINGDLDELEAGKADLISKEFIEVLRLNVRSAGTATLEALQPHPILRRLVFRGPHLPTWIITLTNLRSLTIEFEFLGNSGMASSWPPLGQLQHLEDLTVKGSGMKRVGHDFLGINTRAQSATSSIFPRLKTLTFTKCWIWEEWKDISQEQQKNTSISILPRLLKLQLYVCPALKALPYFLVHKASSLQRLHIYSCTYLKSRYSQGRGQDWTKLSHIPEVIFS